MRQQLSAFDADVSWITQIVTLRGVDHTVDLRIPDESQFKLIKVGDQVRATYTDAVAISMQPVAAK